MPLSRLRLRLTAAFAIVFAVGLAALAAGVLGFLWREASQRFDASLVAVTQEVAGALTRELSADSSVAAAADEVVKEWPSNGDAFAILDEKGALFAGRPHTSVLAAVTSASRQSPDATRLAVDGGVEDVRAVATPFVLPSDPAHRHFRIVAFGSTEGIERDIELLGRSLAPAALLIVLISLAGGYLLARRALRPVSDLSAAIAAIAPTDLSRRLPATEPRDEIGTLAAEFNGLLGRLDDAQRRNRGFVREAAHQIRTPLTLVLGEAGHELGAAAPDAERTRAAMTRVRTAAEQMQRRVDELFLLAEAQAGASVRLDDTVETDGLVLECTDLMRGRAQSLGRALAIGRAEPLVVRANAMLLKEAVLELVENACKHGSASEPVTVSTYATPEGVVLAVESAGDAFTLRDASASSIPEGLGLPIVRWIASAHGSELKVAREGGRNVLSFTIAPAPSA